MTFHGSGGEGCGGSKRISMVPPAPEKADNTSETGSRAAMVKRSVILEDVQVGTGKKRAYTNRRQ